MPLTSTESRLGHSDLSEPHRLLIPIISLGMSLGLFLVIAYVACILFYFLFPDLILNHAVLTLFLPGFKLLDWPSFLLGLIESFGYGWVVALLFGPLFNFFSARQS
jgi:hypothetical protein